jgi:hypothetical protein
MHVTESEARVASEGHRQEGDKNGRCDHTYGKIGAQDSSSPTELKGVISYERVFAFRNRVFCFVDRLVGGLLPDVLKERTSLSFLLLLARFFITRNHPPTRLKNVEQ